MLKKRKRASQQREAMQNASASLSQQRLEWLTRLSTPRGRSAKALSTAEWDAAEGLARVLRGKGNLSALGLFRSGQQWLRVEEVMCLVDEGSLLLLRDGQPLSVHAARVMLLGPQPGTAFEGAAAAKRELSISTFAALHRSGYVCRPPAPLADDDAYRRAGSPTLFAVYERRGFSRRAAEAGAPPTFLVACFHASEPMPPTDALSALARAVAPAALRCACAQQGEALFFDVVSGCG